MYVETQLNLNVEHYSEEKNRHHGIQGRLCPQICHIADEWLLGGKQENARKPGDKNNSISTKNGIQDGMKIDGCQNPSTVTKQEGGTDKICVPQYRNLKLPVDIAQR